MGGGDVGPVLLVGVVGGELVSILQGTFLLGIDALEEQAAACAVLPAALLQSRRCMGLLNFFIAADLHGELGASHRASALFLKLLPAAVRIKEAACECARDGELRLPRDGECKLDVGICFLGELNREGEKPNTDACVLLSLFVLINKLLLLLPPSVAVVAATATTGPRRRGDEQSPAEPTTNTSPCGSPCGKVVCDRAFPPIFLAGELTGLTASLNDCRP